MQSKRTSTGKNVKKRTYFQNIENRNLQRKKYLDQQNAKWQVSQPSKAKRSWVRKDDPKCLVIHTIVRAGSSSRWYLDSGYSRHMSGERELFTKLEEVQGGYVTFGDDNIAKILEIGMIVVPSIPQLIEALYVQGIKHN